MSGLSNSSTACVGRAGERRECAFDLAVDTSLRGALGDADRVSDLTCVGAAVGAVLGMMTEIGVAFVMVGVIVWSVFT